MSNPIFEALLVGLSDEDLAQLERFLGPLRGVPRPRVAPDAEQPLIDEIGLAS